MEIFFKVILYASPLVLLCVFFKLRKLDSLKSANHSNAMINENEKFNKSKIIGKVLGIVILGILYFGLFIMSIMFSDSCGVNDCKFFDTGYTIGGLWLLTSYIITILSEVQNKKLVIFTPKAFFMPYLAIPIFFGIIYLSLVL